MSKVSGSKRKATDQAATAPEAKKSKAKAVGGADSISFKSNTFNGYAFLSNFWPDVKTGAKEAVFQHFPPLRSCYPLIVEVDGVEYKTAEHAFQALRWKKAGNENAAYAIAHAATALDAKKLNTQLKKRYGPFSISPAEEVVIMRKVLRAKFSTTENPVYAAALVTTGTRALHETRGRSASRWTKDVRNPPAQDDLLGQLLGEVRAELRAQGEQAAAPAAAAAGSQ